MARHPKGQHLCAKPLGLDGETWETEVPDHSGAGTAPPNTPTLRLQCPPSRPAAGVPSPGPCQPVHLRGAGPEHHSWSEADRGLAAGDTGPPTPVTDHCPWPSATHRHLQGSREASPMSPSRGLCIPYRVQAMGSLYRVGGPCELPPGPLATQWQPLLGPAYVLVCSAGD